MLACPTSKLDWREHRWQHEACWQSGDEQWCNISNKAEIQLHREGPCRQAWFWIVSMISAGCRCIQSYAGLRTFML